MADSESSINKDLMPQSDAHKCKDRRTRHRQTNVFLLHSTLIKIAVIIVYFGIYVKRISIFYGYIIYVRYNDSGRMGNSSQMFLWRRLYWYYFLL